MKKTDIFTDLQDFMQYAPGIGAETSYEQLGVHIRVTTSDIWRYITVPVYMALRTEPAEDATDEQKETLAEGLQLLKTAIAAGTMYKRQIYSTVDRAGTDNAIYKYQHEELKRSHLDAYWTAVDELLDWLDEHKDIGGYASSEEYARIQQLPIRSATEFDYYFQIDRSAYFFSRVQYIIRSEWEKIKKTTDTNNDEQMQLAKKAICYRTMAKVVMTFDVTEWPKCIRFDLNHEYSKGSAPQSRITLAHNFIDEAESAETALSDLHNSSSSGSGYQNLNKETNKHFTVL